jgi:hypothetical protein
VVNDTPQWLEECNGQDGKAENWMWIGEEVQPARSLSDDPYSHSGCDEIHKVSDDLASGVEFQDNGRLDVEAE